MKTALNLDVALMEAARVHAANSGCTLAEVVELALYDFLLKNADSAQPHRMRLRIGRGRETGSEPAGGISMISRMQEPS
ncbi:MAG: hypothetical protein FJW20_18870 [Acidimicrobiia bacterium]|nr:hypothetical protein [Acidimicrobiia bacterium]